MADYAQIGDRRTISNLLFFTNDRDAWHTAICKYYKSTKKQGICYGRQILVREEANSTPFLTVNVYHNGTVMFQGSEACLNSVQENFITIRSLAETEKQAKKTHRPVESTHMASSCEGPEEEVHCPLTSDIELEQSVSQIRESLSLQEVELIELKEQIASHITTSTQIQNLGEQLCHFKVQFMSYIEQLWDEMREMEQDRESLRRHLKHLKEELLIRDEAMQTLREQIEKRTSFQQPTPSTESPTTQKLVIHPPGGSQPPTKATSPGASTGCRNHHPN